MIRCCSEPPSCGPSRRPLFGPWGPKFGSAQVSRMVSWPPGCGCCTATLPSPCSAPSCSCGLLGGPCRTCAPSSSPPAYASSGASRLCGWRACAVGRSSGPGAGSRLPGLAYSSMHSSQHWAGVWPSSCSSAPRCSMRPRTLWRGGRRWWTPRTVMPIQHSASPCSAASDSPEPKSCAIAFSSSACGCFSWRSLHGCPCCGD
mmetsp:Transcript_12107/g.34683  ORF Transcript_12107/g.34683 Transcript_12107/m.34683 type:complete len:202 (-) Transcript_12107:591-1196(-)